MDDAFGVGDLVESEFKTAKSQLHTAKDLAGLKVGHNVVSIIKQSLGRKCMLEIEVKFLDV